MKIDAGFLAKYKAAILSVVAPLGLDVGVGTKRGDVVIVFALYDGDGSWDHVYELAIAKRLILACPDEQEACRRIAMIVDGVRAAGHLGAAPVARAS